MVFNLAEKKEIEKKRLVSLEWGTAAQ